MYLPKEYTYKYITESKMVTRKPVYLKSVIANPKDTDRGVVTVRNGQKSDSDIIFCLTTGLNLSAPIDLGRPVYIPKGLYVSLDTHVSNVSVLYKEISCSSELEKPI